MFVFQLQKMSELALVATFSMISYVIIFYIIFSLLFRQEQPGPAPETGPVPPTPNPVQMLPAPVQTPMRFAPQPRRMLFRAPVPAPRRVRRPMPGAQLNPPPPY